MPPDIPQEEKSVPPSAADTDGEYDYQALRKKILTTWGKQEEGKELDLPDEMEKPVYHEKPLPKPPLSATVTDIPSKQPIISENFFLPSKIRQKSKRVYPHERVRPF